MMSSAHINNSKRKLASLSIFIAGFLSSPTNTHAQYNIQDLDDTLLNDILHSYTDHVESTCTGNQDTTTFSFEYPGVNVDSEWNEAFVPFEEGLFQASMTHTDPGNNSWTIRIGQGGNMYSHYCPNLHGETIAPQNHLNSPWIDEVDQIVSVNEELNEAPGQCNGDTCPEYFIHGAGTYQEDSPYTDVPFYSQSLAKTCKDNYCIFASWSQQAHLPTLFTSPIISFNKYTNCGNGIIEHTQMIYNFALFGSANFPDDPATADQNEQDILLDQTYFNLPWSGVRPSNLPFALEPETDGTFDYEDPSTVDYCPICPWGTDNPGGSQGRCARADLENLGGYTTFVGNGLLVDLPEVDQTPYLPCRKPDESCYGSNEDGSLKVTTCMADPSECYDIDNMPKAGYVPIELEVPPNSTPDCQDRNNNPFSNGWEIRCKLTAAGFGRTFDYLDASAANDPCAPWVGGTIDIYRNDTGLGFKATYIRHFSYGTDQWLYLRVEAESFSDAQALVHEHLDNSGNPNSLPLSIRVGTPPINNIPASYDPGSLPSVTFVAGDGVSPLPGKFRRRLGAANVARDYHVYTVNYHSVGARLTPGNALYKRDFIFASDLASTKVTADDLKEKVVYDMIEDTRWNARQVDIYTTGNSFDVVAATSTQDASTTCTSPSSTLQCSGFSTPQPGGYHPFFYVTCGSSSYLGPDPYFFAPGNGNGTDDWFMFPGMSSDNNEAIQSYACANEDPSVRPSWKLMGFFTSSCAPLSDAVFDDNICVVPPPPTSEPTNHPTSPPSSPPVEPSPSLGSTKVWCSKPDISCSSDASGCMANPSECYDPETGSVNDGYTPVKLEVPANSSPKCRDRGKKGNGYEIMCQLRSKGFGRTSSPYLSSPVGGTMGFYREDNNLGFETTFIRHWSWSPYDYWLFLRIDAPNYLAARNRVHSYLDNTGNPNPLPLRFEYNP